MPEEKESSKAPVSVKSEPVLNNKVPIVSAPTEAPKTGLGEESIIKSVIASLGKKSNDHTVSLNKALSYLSAALVQLEAHSKVKPVA